MFRDRYIPVRKKVTPSYNPNLGFIGRTKVDVANYLFSHGKKGLGHQHTENLVRHIMHQGAVKNYLQSRKLTQFLKQRDLTFSKLTSKGVYKIFTVPCTTSIVPLSKSLFNQIDASAKNFVFSLRLILQQIYSSRRPEEAPFVKALPERVRKIFLNAIKTSPHYFPQLHHPVMKDYPFFDNVGLDLVLVADYQNQAQTWVDMATQGRSKEIPELPFKILELNAGSPSGASNNMNILEGIYGQDPELLKSLGLVMPNDHFTRLHQTFKCLGEFWTGRTDGVQIILPPGGGNGASPEIHQLAAFSGLIYADPAQLYNDRENHIRLRTITGKDPIVTAIYSRINADSALFDPSKGILLRDPENGETLYLMDILKFDKDKGKLCPIVDPQGRPIPLLSDYTVPNLLTAIHSRKIYMGGLNRVLDNKIILPILTVYGPKFFRRDMARNGLNPNLPLITNPETLPPNKKSIGIVEKNPDDWVIKTPNLSGGQGIYIMKTLPPKHQEEILQKIKANPGAYSYQKLVKIARIPVAMKEFNKTTRFANLAADLRMWVFYGAGNHALPQLTHNALVRFAPHEKGPMSSIVNTSKGGGYAPFVVVDDTHSFESVSPTELAKPVTPVPFQSDLPSLAAAQLVQVARILQKMRHVLSSEKPNSYHLNDLALGLKNQCREIVSFLNPRCMIDVYNIINIIEPKVSLKKQAADLYMIRHHQIEMVELLNKYENKNFSIKISALVENLTAFNKNLSISDYTAEDRKADQQILRDVKQVLAKVRPQKSILPKDLRRLAYLVKAIINVDCSTPVLCARSINNILKLIDSFCTQARKRLGQSGHGEEFAQLFTTEYRLADLKFEGIYLEKETVNRQVMIATQKEFMSNELLVDSDFIPEHLQAARQAWLNVKAAAEKMTKEKSQQYLEKKRKEHFVLYPFLKRYQELINTPDNNDSQQLLEILPILPYARFNLENYARGLNIPMEELISDHLRPGRIALLNKRQIHKSRLSFQNYAGECFAKKRVNHGLLSDSDIYTWVATETGPFVQALTAGHEIVHYQQISETMKMEKEAIKKGPMDFANFLNYYGNFLGHSSRNFESLSVDLSIIRRPLYGLIDVMHLYAHRPLISALTKSLDYPTNELWEKELDKYGHYFGYFLPNGPQIRVKAIHEIIPALENAKNIRFARDLGLEVPYDEIKSALPCANTAQVNFFRSQIEEAIYASNINWETLRLIGSNQYFGVRLPKNKEHKDSLLLPPALAPITLSTSYNQTQQ
jgi:uncharacterized circularly permuted ATP-grasp superfamily protein